MKIQQGHEDSARPDWSYVIWQKIYEYIVQESPPYLTKNREVPNFNMKSQLNQGSF